MRLRVGLIGLGDAWQRRHAPALRAMADRFEVRLVCEQVGHRAEQAAAEFAAVSVEGYRAMAHREDIDAVLVLAPQWYGALPILAACEAGKAVYCAAGLDLDADDAQLIQQRIHETGNLVVVEFPRRHAPATLRLKELIATRLGAPRLLFCHCRLATATCRETTTTGTTRRASIRDLVELVDWCCYVAGSEARWVAGAMHSAACPPGEEDYQMMSLGFSPLAPPRKEISSEEILAQISCGRYIPAGWHEAIGYRPLAALQVSCEKGIAFVDLPSTLVWFDEAGRHQESLDSERPVGERLLAQFHLAVTGTNCRSCDLDDAYRALEIVRQARRSHAEGRRIFL